MGDLSRSLSRSLSRAKGASLERAIMEAFGALPDVVVYRNVVAHAALRSGAQILTGIGGKGAPDFLLEVRTRAGHWCALWVETKNGDHARLSPEQRAWHDAARRLGRHVVLARSVDDVRQAVAAIRGGAP